MPDEKLIHASALEALTGLTDRRHRQLAKQGYFPPPVESNYELAATIRGMFKYYRETKETRDELRQEKTGQIKAQRQILEIQLERERGDSARVADAIAALGKPVEALRQRILGIAKATREEKEEMINDCQQIILSAKRLKRGNRRHSRADDSAPFSETI